MVTSDNGYSMQPDIARIVVAYRDDDRRETFHVPAERKDTDRPSRAVSAFEFKPQTGLAIERYDGSTTFIPAASIRWIKFEKREEATNG